MDQTVFIVDDDAEIREALSLLFRSVGYPVTAFEQASDLLDRALRDPAGCVVSDVRMPTLDGLAFQRHLRTAGVMLPVIFVSGYADVALGVAAMREGAYSFLTKPFREQELLEAVAGALELERSTRAARRERAAMQAAFEALDAREREIMLAVANGEANKVIAHRLGLSEITIKVVRARMMRKMGAASTAQLVRVAERLGM